jgi:hypothetical protein
MRGGSPSTGSAVKFAVEANREKFRPASLVARRVETIADLGELRFLLSLTKWRSTGKRRCGTERTFVFCAVTGEHAHRECRRW